MPCDRGCDAVGDSRVGAETRLPSDLHIGRSLVCTRGISLEYTRGELILFVHAKLVCTRGSLVCTRGLHG